jgi:hypothetical protein
MRIWRGSGCGSGSTILVYNNRILLIFLYLSGEDAEEKALGKSGLPLLRPLQDLRPGEKDQLEVTFQD